MAVPRVNHGFGRLSNSVWGLIALILLCVGGGCEKSVTVNDPGVEAQAILAKWKSAPVELELPRPSFDDHQEQFVVLLLWFVLAAIIVGTVATLLLLLTLGLIAAGVVSASVVIGVMRRSVSTGFRALFLQIGGVFGLIAGALGAWLFILLAKLPMNSAQPWVIGPLVGVVFGLLAAWMFNFAWGRCVEWIARKLPGKKVLEVEAERVVDDGSDPFKKTA